MAKAETILKTKINECAAQEKKLQAQAQILSKEQRELLEAAAEVAAEKTIKLLTEAASELACKSVHSNAAYQNTNVPKGTFTYQIHVIGNKPHISWTVTADAKADAAIKANWKATKELYKQIADNNNTWIDWRRKLQDLPSMERKAKAAVAAERLKGSEEGLKILATLEAQLDDGIRLLGVS
jgi:hypothetical protein